ncbi:predicted protein [Scheffersomyces stipitis CBS 6054]|uniref:ER membrane protein complex subunit 4 n=1 Tax=Scheffersomyces stipitis (strain ATCC 58785 / CBS 6054 / NBRC 10063 / NRRL Y-11545) TaxID=322104 RepID=A3LPJ1_PICST|nr:predicted protein [Scheffersomyces stipitis CBS 6054]ABN65055.2 predicted protein [Scheffersomyces stipitis CBS 6054]KAG2736291.1 hypothetical protein G9P44_000381 [Scheffersomyces stipitis]
MSYTEITKPEIVATPKSTKKPLVLPPGFGQDGKSASGKTKKVSFKNGDEQMEELKVKKAWELATGPAKSIPMNAIMSYMTGNSLQIIPMTMTLMLLWNPLKAIFTETNDTFKGLITKKNSSNILLAKLGFVFFQLLNMSIGIYKLYTMGLIPNTEADWLAWKELKSFDERLSFY